MIALLVMTDGRDDVLARTMASADEHLVGANPGLITGRVIHDDTADPDHADVLFRAYPGWTVITPMARRGFGGAIRHAWENLAKRPERFVFHLEDDFTFTRPVDLTGMATVLDRFHNLTQLALRRQPWNAAELAAGGVIEQAPNDYTDCFWDGYSWLEHRRFFTTNPSLYRSSLCRRHWSRGPESEGRFTADILGDPHVRFGYWGARDSGEAVTHIGHARVGHGY